MDPDILTRMWLKCGQLSLFGVNNGTGRIIKYGYKEKDLSRLMSNPPPPMAVSYTHLDVYKRQAIGSIVCLVVGDGIVFRKIEAVCVW